MLSKEIWAAGAWQRMAWSIASDISTRESLKENPRKGFVKWLELPQLWNIIMRR
jgi:hypothetical protein